MKARSTLLSPPSALYGCLFAGVVRDTRGSELSDRDRLNFFPASPLVTVTHVVEGALSESAASLDTPTNPGPLLPRSFVMPPQDRPTVSWSAGPILAASVGVFPDAWERLAPFDVPARLARAFDGADDVVDGWSRFCADLTPVWRAVRRSNVTAWSDLPHIADWTRGVVSRAALSGPGRRVRSVERRLKRWTGLTRRSLMFFASFERLHGISVRNAGAPLAEIAAEAGFADQSHMGRVVRRATGFSPARLNQLIATEEAFWCYRLLGEGL